MYKRFAILAIAIALVAGCNKEEKQKVAQLEGELAALEGQQLPGVPAGQDVVTPNQGAFGFTFDVAKYGVDAGGSVTVGYSLDEEATIEVIAGDGWSASVNATDSKSGQIIVTCPDPAVHSDIVAKAVTADGRSVAVALPLMIRNPYTDVTRTDVAALAYYALYPGIATDYHFKMMADAGFNMLTIESVDNWQTQLTLAHKYGMKGVLFINGPAGEYYMTGGTSTRLAEVVNEAKTYPALAGYQIADEPSVVNINQFVYEAEAVRALDPDHPIYINMHPASASSNSTGVDTYEEYIETYTSRCNLSFITFDQYPVFTSGIDPTWSTSLNVIRDISRRKGIPFWAFTLCCREWNREDPTLGNIRMQCNTNLAYGAQVNQFFVYRSTSGTDFAPLQTWEWADELHETKRFLSDSEVKYTAAYDDCKAYNIEMHNRGFVFAGCDAYKIRYIREAELYGYFLSDSDLPPQISSFTASGTALVSFIENGGNYYMVTVNRDWTQPMTVDVTFEDMVYVIDHDGVFNEMHPGHETLTVDAGDMLVIKWK